MRERYESSENMKIAYIIPQYLPSTSGDVRDIHYFASRMVETGSISTVFTTDAGSEDAIFSNKGVILKEKSEIIDDVEIRRFPIKMRFLSIFKFLVDKDRLLKNTQEINQYIQNFKNKSSNNLGIVSLMGVRPPISRKLYKNLLQAKDYDIYHVSGISLSHAMYAYNASIKNNIPLVIRPAFHFADKFYYNPMNFKILKHADAIIANTDAEVKIFSEFGIDPQKIIAVGCGVDLEKHSNVNADEVEKIKSDYSFDKYDANVLFLSRLQKEKGVFTVINSIIELNRRDNKIQLLIAGSDYGGNSKLIEQISAKQDFIKYLGRISEEEKISLLHACDMLVVPSIADSFGIVYIEAWVCKMPVIGADIPSTRSLISYGEDGFYIGYGDEDSLMKKIKFLSENPDERIAMGKRGYKKVTDRYTNKIVFNRVYEIYNRVTNKNR